MTDNKIKIILDCDPGHDDAVAIMLASLSEKIDLLAVTVVSGNQTIEKTGNNALNILEYLNKDIPIALGMSRPILKDRVICSEIHGQSGLDGFDFPPHKYKLSEKNAMQLIIDTLLAKSNKDNDSEKITIVTTGPMSNLAMALRIKPEITQYIKEIVLMGGSMGYGNVSPAAEFNIFTDPEAAYICFTSGLPVKMVSLDVTRKVLVLPNVMERMKKLNTKCSKLFDALMIFFNKTQKEVFNLDGGPLHDPATIVSLIDEKIITFKKMFVEIDISRGISYGRTNCDVTGYTKREPNVWVSVDIDVEKYWDVIESILKKY